MKKSRTARNLKRRVKTRKVMRGGVTQPVIDALKTVVDSMKSNEEYQQLQKSLEELINVSETADTVNAAPPTVNADSTVNAAPPTVNVVPPTPNDSESASSSSAPAPPASQSVNDAPAPAPAPKQIPAFKQQDSSRTFNTFNGKVKTNYFQIMNKITKFFKIIDNKIKMAVDEEDKKTFTDRKKKYETVKTLLENATTEDEVTNIITANEVNFDSGNIVSGGTRKRKITQRKRAKTLKKKKNKAGKR